MTQNPPNPEVTPAAPDVDTGDLEVEAAQAVAKVEPEAPKAKLKAPKAPKAKFSLTFALLTILALLVSGGIVYFFFFAENTVEVTLHSDPPGATIILDGKQLGISPQKTKVTPGTHTLIFQQPGFETFEEQIEVQLDGTVIEKTLTPLTPQQPPTN